MSAPKLMQTYNVKLLTAGWSSITDRFYPCSALKRVVNQFSPGIGDFVFSGDQISLRLDLNNVSHRTNRLYLKDEGRELWGEVQTLDTRCGNLVTDLYKRNNIRFDVALMGCINKFGEVETDSVQYLRVTAYGVYK